MSLSDFIETSVSDQARRKLFERKLAVRKKLQGTKLSELDMTGAEFCSYLSIMNQNQGMHGGEPSESEIILFEVKLKRIK